MTHDPTTTGEALAWLAARRSAIGTALATALAVLAPVLVAEEPITAVVGLAAAGAAISGYAAGYYAIGRVEKALAGASTAGLASIASGLVLDLSWQAITVTTGVIVFAELGLVPALPSTRGSAATPTVTLVPAVYAVDRVPGPDHRADPRT